MSNSRTWWLVAPAVLAGAASIVAAAPSLQQRGQGQGTQGTQTQGGTQAGTPPRGQGAASQQQTRDTQTTPVVGTATITGNVVLDGSGSPVRRARVALNGQGLPGGRSVLTDDQGRFAFTALPAGRFTMNASKSGFVTIAYGAKKAGRAGTPIQLVDGQRLEKATIRMPRGSVVTGVVIDEGGEPSPGTQVRVMRFVTQTGERTLQQAGQDQTDDRGIYRIYGLQPGEYVVSAVPRMSMNDVAQGIRAQVEALVQQAAADAGRGGGGQGGGGGRAGQGAGPMGNMLGGGRGQQLLEQAAVLQQQLQQTQGDQPVGYAPVYYPGTTAPGSAMSVTLAVGEERAGVDFQLQLVPTAKIEGVITSPSGPLPPGLQITMTPAGQQNMPPIPGISSNQTRADQSGKFSFSNVTPGAYTIQARGVLFDPATVPGSAPGAPPGGPGTRGGGRGRGAISQVLWASADVAVNGQNLSDVALNLQPGLTMTGRVAFEGTTQQPPADMTRVRVMLNPTGAQAAEFAGPMPPTDVDATGHFSIAGVAPGKYTLRGNVPAAAQTGQAPTGQAQQGAAGAGGGRGGGRAAGGGQAGGGGGNSGWVLKSAVVAGRDTLDFPLVIGPGDRAPDAVLTFTDRTQELTGTLQDATGRPTADYMIIVFPVDNRYWVPQARRIIATRPGTDGTFTIRSLPPGDYRLTAVTDAEPGEWYDPAFLSQLVGPSLPFSLGPGESKKQDIKVAGGGL